MAAQKLLDGVTSDTTGAAVGWNGGRGTFAVSSSSFGGGTVKLQASPDNGTTWIAVGTSTNLTATGMATFDLTAGFLVRAVLTGSTTPSALTAWLSGP